MMEQSKRKMTKQEIKDFVSIRLLYLVVQLGLRNCAFSIIMGIVPFIVHFFHANVITLIIIDMVITFIIVECIFQRLIYNYAYKNFNQDNKKWWSKLNIAIAPIIIYFLINLLHFGFTALFLLESDSFLFESDVEMIYMLMVYGKQINSDSNLLKTLREFVFDDKYRLHFSAYAVSYLISTIPRLSISLFVTHRATQKRIQDRNAIIGKSL